MEPATGYLIGSGISALGSMIGSGISAAGSRSAANAAADRAYSLWKTQAEYNTPANQVKRYLEAGLNPNLIYGQVSSGNMSTTPDLPYSNGSSEIANGLSLTLDKIGQMFGQYAARKEAKALQDSLEEQRQNQLTIQRLNIQLLQKNLEERELGLVARRAGMAQPVMGSAIAPQSDWIDKGNAIADNISRNYLSYLPGYGLVYRGLGDISSGRFFSGISKVGRGTAISAPSFYYLLKSPFSYLKNKFGWK